MNRKPFDNMARELFGEALSSDGFTCEKSHSCTFYRQVGDDIYHFISPDRSMRGEWYDVKVFPASPRLDPYFHESFPDGVGIPSDSFSQLSPRGVGLDQERFSCRTRERFQKRFESTVRPLIMEYAIPYLNRFHSIEDMIPILKHPLFIGMGLYVTGRVDEARPILEQERKRLMMIGSTDRAVTTRLAQINELLGASNGKG